MNLSQVQPTLRNHVGQDVQFPPYWGHMLPVCRGHHLWIYQHIRVSVLILMNVPVTFLLSWHSQYRRTHTSWGCTHGISDVVVSVGR